jgi:hypothetical protein
MAQKQGPLPYSKDSSTTRIIAMWRYRAGLKLNLLIKFCLAGENHDKTT